MAALMFWISASGWGWLQYEGISAAGAGEADEKATATATTAGREQVKLALLTYAGGTTPSCFSDGFLETVALETSVPVATELARVDLEQEDLAQYPLVIFAGEKSFRLSGREREKLRGYIQRGGFILASAGCANLPWAESFRKEWDGLGLTGEWRMIPIQHPVFTQGIFKIDQVMTRMATDLPPLLGWFEGEQLCAVFSPIGLNDTDHAGKGCCCCGGNEIRNARQINANLCLYVLTH